MILSDYESYKNGFGPFIGDILTVNMNNTTHLQSIFLHN